MTDLATPADPRPARRADLTRRAVAAAVAVAREHGLRVDDPVGDGYVRYFVSLIRS